MSKRAKRLKFEAEKQQSTAIKPAFHMDVEKQTIGECAAIAREAYISVIGQAEFDRRFKAYKLTDIRSVLTSLDTSPKEAIGWLVIYLDSIGLGHYRLQDPGFHKDFNRLHGVPNN